MFSGAVALMTVLGLGLGLGGCSSGEPGEAVAARDQIEVASAVDVPSEADDAGETDADHTDGDAETSSSDDAADGTAGDAVAPTDLEALFGSGGCMEVAGILMGWGFTLLGTLTEGTALVQSDVDALFATASELPADLHPHVAVLRDALNAAVGKPQGAALELVGTPEVDNAMNKISEYSDAACGGE